MALSLAPGTLLNERFKITRLVSENADGAVYRVIDTKITEMAYLAYEYYPSFVTANQQQIPDERFKQAGTIAKALQHPRLLQVYDTFIEGNRYYVITEYLEGLSFTALLKLGTTPIPENQVLNWMLQLCDVLEYLNDLPNPLYRNELDPSSIMIDRDSSIKIPAFEFHALFAPQDEMNWTAAPEIKEPQVEPASAQIYSVGAVCYFLLTRKAAFPDAPEVATINETVSPKINELLKACLRLEPGLRPANVKILAGKVGEILYPVQTTAPLTKKATRWTIAEKLNQFVAAGLTALLWLRKRPLYVIAIPLIFWIIHTNFHPRSFINFHKTGPLLYVTSRDEALALDPDSLKILHEIPAIEQAFTSFASTDNHEIWFATHKGTVYALNPENDTMLHSFAIGQGQTIGAISTKQKNIFFILLTRENIVARVAALTGRLVAASPVPRNPTGLIYNSDKEELYVTNAGTKRLTVLDASKMTPKGILKLRDVPSQIAQSMDGKYLYFLYNSLGQIDVLDQATRKISPSISLEQPGPYSITPWEQGLVVTLFGKGQVLLYEFPGATLKAQVFIPKPTLGYYLSPLNRILALSNGSLFSINPSSGRVIEHIKVGTLASSILYVP